MLHKIADANSAHMAQVVRGFVSKVMNWHASRDDDFRSPIRRGMARVKPREHARERILTNDELRLVWQGRRAFNSALCRLVQSLLLTAG
jgi:hypothetical protein